MKIKTLLFPFLILLTLVVSCTNRPGQEDYLRKVLSELEKIESASYNITHMSIKAYETEPDYVEKYFIMEFDHPADSTIGASYIELGEENGLPLLNFGYDGNIRVLTYHEHQGLIIDDFTHRPLPFRPVNPPFFNHVKNIIRYMLSTDDHIRIEMEEREDHLYVKLTIDEEKQVLFFGKAHQVENPYTDPLSIYELWISKENDLPYDLRIEMTNYTVRHTCSNVKINQLKAEEMDLYAYFPDGYEIRDYGQKQHTVPDINGLIGNRAPDWILKEWNNQPLSLKDFTTKVLLINFTGIGCGPCLVSIPFLNGLKDHFQEDELSLVSIETWSRKTNSLKSYAEKYAINYPFVADEEGVDKNYTVNAVPAFFVLDQDRVIRKVFTGYKKGTTDQEILEAIHALL